MSLKNKREGPLADVALSATTRKRRFTNPCSRQLLLKAIMTRLVPEVGYE